MVRPRPPERACPHGPSVLSPRSVGVAGRPLLECRRPGPRVAIPPCAAGRRQCAGGTAPAGRAGLVLGRDRGGGGARGDGGGRRGVAPGRQCRGCGRGHRLCPGGHPSVRRQPRRWGLPVALAAWPLPGAGPGVRHCRTARRPRLRHRREFPRDRPPRRPPGVLPGGGWSPRSSPGHRRVAGHGGAGQRGGPAAGPALLWPIVAAAGDRAGHHPGGAGLSGERGPQPLPGRRRAGAAARS